MTLTTLSNWLMQNEESMDRQKTKIHLTFFTNAILNNIHLYCMGALVSQELTLLHSMQIMVYKKIAKQYFTNDFQNCF